MRGWRIQDAFDVLDFECSLISRLLVVVKQGIIVGAQVYIRASG